MIGEEEAVFATLDNGKIMIKSRLRCEEGEREGEVISSSLTFLYQEVSPLEASKIEICS